MMKYKRLFELAVFRLVIDANCPDIRPDFCPYKHPEIIEAEMDICIKCWEEHFKKELKEQEEIEKEIKSRKKSEKS